MASYQFKGSVLRLSFIAGETEDGKPVKKMKSYRNLYDTADAAAVSTVAEALAQLSTLPLVDVEKIETAFVRN